MKKVTNFINGTWQTSAAVDYLEVVNPATAETLGHVPLSPTSEVDAAAQVAQQAFETWRRVPTLHKAKFTT